jgi:acetoacetyl-CoA synthetase
MGTAEFYSIVENLPEIAEALVIDNSRLGREDQLLLFVVLRAGYQLDDHLRSRIKQQLRSEGSPRHVPDGIHSVPEIPHTLNGKKLEIPIKRLLAGTPVEQVMNRDTVANSAALQYFVDWAHQSASPLSA